MEARALFGRFVWRGINIYDVTIHPSRGSRINSTLKVCEPNRAAHASNPSESNWTQRCDSTFGFFGYS